MDFFLQNNWIKVEVPLKHIKRYENCLAKTSESESLVKYLNWRREFLKNIFFSFVKKEKKWTEILFEKFRTKLQIFMENGSGKIKKFLMRFKDKATLRNFLWIS